MGNQEPVDTDASVGQRGMETPPTGETCKTCGKPVVLLGLNCCPEHRGASWWWSKTHPGDRVVNIPWPFEGLRYCPRCGYPNSIEPCSCSPRASL